MKKWIGIGLAAVLISCFTAAWVVYNLSKTYADLPRKGEGRSMGIDIPRGAGPRKVATILAKHQVIDDPVAFTRWVRYMERSAGRFKAGELAFRDNMTPREVLRVLIDGTPFLRRLTVPEGLRIDEVAALFAGAGLADAEKFERRAREPAFARSLGIPHDSLEGFLFPETYGFRRDVPLDTIFKSMVEAYKNTFRPEWKQRARTLRMTELQVITLASIVEKETGAPAERPLIAGVFHNRLKRGWKLQTDPTVIYAEILAKGSFDGTIHKSDLERDHPYNTYRRTGLPPGPICSPGEAAIKAALYPEKTRHLYFVSKNDGTHQFCPTLNCHNRWVNKYQRKGD